MNKISGRISVIVLCLSFSAAATAATSAQQDVAQLRSQPGMRQIQINVVNGQAAGPFFLQGELAAVKHQVPTIVSGMAAPRVVNLEQAARAFLLEHKMLWGIDSAQQLILLTTKIDTSGHVHLGFGRLVGAWPVAAMQILVHFNSAGDITAVNGNLVPVSAELLEFVLGVTPNQLWSSEQIMARSQSLFPSSSIKILKSELQAITTAPFLIWRCDLVDLSRGQRFDTTFNALTGELVTNTLRLHAREINSNLESAHVVP